VIHCPLKDASSQILRIVEVPRSIVDVVEDAIYVTFVEQTKRIAVTLRSVSQNIFFVEFGIRHGSPYRRGLKELTPAGFGSCLGV
jgi:hypothetical protein